AGPCAGRCQLCQPAGRRVVAKCAHAAGTESAATRTECNRSAGGRSAVGHRRTRPRPLRRVLAFPRLPQRQIGVLNAVGKATTTMMSRASAPEDFDLYIWEGTSDIAAQAERCLQGMDVNVVRADAGMAFPPPRDKARVAVALVSVT